MTKKINNESKAEKIARAYGYLRKDEVHLLNRVVRSLKKGAVVINIGAGTGTTAISVLEERPDLAKTFYTIDNREDSNPYGGLLNEREVFKSVDMTHLLPNQILGDSKQVGKEWKGPKIDFLIIDAGHYYDDCYGDMTAWEPHLKNGALIAINDYGTERWRWVKLAVDDRMKQTGKYKRIELVFTTLLLEYRETEQERNNKQ